MATQSLNFLCPPKTLRCLSKAPAISFPSSSVALVLNRRHQLRIVFPSDLLTASSNGATAASLSIEVDAVTEVELKENRFRSTRRTKLVCTIGPATCKAEQMEALAVGGMNIARLNICHGTHEWHREVIKIVRRMNEEKGFAIAVMMDTEGSEIHMGDIGGVPSAKDKAVSTIIKQYISGAFSHHLIEVSGNPFIASSDF